MFPDLFGADKARSHLAAGVLFRFDWMVETVLLPDPVVQCVFKPEKAYVSGNAASCCRIECSDRVNPGRNAQ
ncbi:hypothetical protein [Roseibium aggregatum]|jgi:hypothetical protein|uniref:hypothetical protein n=1 Tax=Roseibium aggregatum TaxID=187304 RepID=UPI003A9863E8